MCRALQLAGVYVSHWNVPRGSFFTWIYYGNASSFTTAFNFKYVL